MVTIFDIADYNHARISEEDFNLIRDTAYGTYVEVGTFHGASAYAASQNATSVTTIDIYDWQPKVYGEKVTFFKGTSVDYAKQFTTPFINVLFVDGSHEEDSVRKDCNALIPLVKKGGTIMFDDYNVNNPASGVYPTVNEAIKKYNLTIIRETAYPTCSVLVCKI